MRNTVTSRYANPARPVMDLATRHALINQSCKATLNGAPAHIMGAHLDFALVADYTGNRIEYAWETVQFVMTEKQGRFRA